MTILWFPLFSGCVTLQTQYNTADPKYQFGEAFLLKLSELLIVHLAYVVLMFDILYFEADLLIGFQRNDSHAFIKMFWDLL